MAYFSIKKEFRNLLLLFASLFFYAWGEPHLQWLMWAIITINYFAAIFIGKYEEKARIILIIAIVVNLGFLAYFKYVNFFVENAVALVGIDIKIAQITMPLGVSFFIFQAISYIVDVYRKETPPQTNFYKTALYISLFPQLIAGPIIRYGDICGQIDNRLESFAKVEQGIKRFIIGLSKKVLIANTAAEVVDKIFAPQDAELAFQHAESSEAIGKTIIRFR
jgi:alginate O-acetyltransferase complex protein AlgI